MLSIAWLLLNRSSKISYIASGLLVGITASFRPSFILFFLPFLICQKYTFLFGGILGLLFSLSLSYVVVGGFIWNKYILAMLGMTNFIDLNSYLPLEESTFSNQNITYPKTFEGFEATILNPLADYFSDTSLLNVLNTLKASNKLEILIIGFIFTMGFLFLYFLKYIWKNKDIKFIFLFATLVCLIGDYFIPVGRYSYYDIQLILPLLIIINQADSINSINNKAIAFLLLGLLLSIGCFLWIPKILFFSSYLIAFYLIVTSLILLKQNYR